jgi:hypothetical protein
MVCSARRYVCCRTGCCESCGRGLTCAVKYRIRLMLSRGSNTLGALDELQPTDRGVAATGAL